MAATAATPTIKSLVLVFIARPSPDKCYTNVTEPAGFDRRSFNQEGHGSGVHGAEPGGILSADSAIQRRFLLCCKRAGYALREVAQGQRPDGYADQAQHLDPEVFEHAPNVAVFSFLQGDCQPGIAVSLPQYACLVYL